MGHGSDKLYVTHTEWATGGYTNSGSGHQGPKKQTEFQRLPFDCCALSLQPFDVPVAVREEDGTANVFDLVNILPYIKKYGTNPVTGRPLTTSSLIKLNFFRNASSENVYSDPVTFKPFTPHSHIVFLATTGNVFAYESIERLCIKAKSWRDLVSDEKFKREDIVTLQDPHNLSSRDLSKFDYLSTGKSAGVVKDDSRLSGINVGASGSAAKILQQIAAKNTPATPEEPIASTSTTAVVPKEKKIGIIAPKPVDNTTPYNSAHYSTGLAAASFTSTSQNLETRSQRALIDEEEFMFDEISSLVKEKDLAKRKAYLRVNVEVAGAGRVGGSLNFELHCDKAPKTCYNFIMLAKEGKYDNTIFHRNIPGFMIQGGDPTGTGSGGKSFWGEHFRDEYDVKDAKKHDARGVLSMANSGAATNGSQFFVTFRATPHLDNKHTVFGTLVGGEDVLTKLEQVPSDKASDRPLREIKITNIEIFSDPFQSYKNRLANRLAARASESTTASSKEKTRLEREADRVSWFGEDLDLKKAKAEADADAERKRKRVGGGGDEGEFLKSLGEGTVAGVGKYLSAGGGGVKPKGGAIGGSSSLGGGEKKKRKGGGFGDFSAW